MEDVLVLQAWTHANMTNVKMKNHAKLFRGGAHIVEDFFGVRGVGQLADRHDIAVWSQGLVVHLPDKLMDTRAIAPHANSGLNVAFWVRDGCIGEVDIFAVLVDSVNSESIHPLVEPEADSALVDSLAGGSVVPVEIWLLLCVEMKVIFPSGFIPGPYAMTRQSCIDDQEDESRTCATGEIPTIITRRHPVALSIVAWRAPEIPVPLRIVLAAPTLLEPGMFVAGMVHNQIEDQLHAALMTGFD